MSFRALRIVPALSTDILLSGIVIGALCTNLPLSHYYLSKGFFIYLLNVTGHITLHLPGTFTTNPTNVVNGSLWTIAPEISCYIFLALMLISKIYRDARTYLIVAVTLIALALVCDHRPGATLLHTSAHPYHLFLAFVFGNLAFHFRAHIPSNAWIFFGCAMAGLALIQNTSFVILGIAALTYCTVWLGLQRLPLPRLLNSGDYSYGVYLYAYPVQQLTMHWLPQMRQWYWNILIAAPITFCFALFSWHCIESPTLALKSRMKSLASYEVVLLSNPLVRFGLAVGFLAYAVLLLHWSAFDLSVGINFTKLPYTVLATIAVIALLVAAAGALHRPRKAALADAAA